MASISITFTYDQDTEQQAIRHHTQGPELARALGEFDNWLRGRIKYANLDTGGLVPEEVRAHLWEILVDRGITLCD